MDVRVEARRRFAPEIPHVVFHAGNISKEAWAADATHVDESEKGPLPCGVLRTTPLPPFSGRLAEFMRDQEAKADALRAGHAKKKDAKQKTTVARAELAGQGNWARFYVFPWLRKRGVKHALYLDVDTFAVRPLAPFFAAMKSSKATLVAARSTSKLTAHPFPTTAYARRLGYDGPRGDAPSGRSCRAVATPPSPRRRRDAAVAPLPPRCGRRDARRRPDVSAGTRTRTTRSTRASSRAVTSRCLQDAFVRCVGRCVLLEETQRRFDEF